MTMTITITSSATEHAALFLLVCVTAMSAPSILVLGFTSTSFNFGHLHSSRHCQSSLSSSAALRFRKHSEYCHLQWHTQRNHRPIVPAVVATATTRATSTSQLNNNLYDDWSSDLLSSSQSEYTYDDLRLMPTDEIDIEESIVQCLEEFMDSEYGSTMFGRHDVLASVGITGSIDFVSLEGPEVILTLTGRFWHRRETVLGKAAMYLNARIPELTSIRVSSPNELADFEDIIDEFTGEILYREDKRSPDFNGDRETMEYQGLDPDARGPFVFASGGSMIRPA